MADDAFDLGYVSDTLWFGDKLPAHGSADISYAARTLTFRGTFVCAHVHDPLVIEHGVGIVRRCSWCGEQTAKL